MTDTFLRFLVLATAVVQIIFPYFVNPFRNGAQPVRGTEPSQIEPAEYAFAIWGPIYLLAVVYAVWQLTPTGRAAPVTARIAPLAIALYAGSSVWLAAAQYGPLWATMPVLASMALCAVLALKLGTDTTRPSWLQVLCLILPFGLYAGWTVCATFVNIAEVAPRYGFNRFELSIAGYAVLSIAVVTAAVAAVLWLTQGNLVFAATAVWALVAIIVAASTRPVDNAVPIAAGAALVAVIAFTAYVRFRGQDA
jgi:hypothetical protein